MSPCYKWLGVYLASLSTLLVACHSAKSTTGVSTDGCSIEATVLDKRGLDLCRFVLELKDGIQVLPLEIADNDFLFSEGQKLKIGYKKLDGIVTACMSGGETVAITCIQEIAPGTGKYGTLIDRPCEETQSPLSVNWMNKIIIRNKVTEVKKGLYQGETAYLFVSPISRILCDCRGTLICESQTDSDKCFLRIAAAGIHESIWAMK
jgi:hypothetical protein